MEITTELVNHLAELSRLEFDEIQTENFKHQFEETLIQMKNLDRINTDNIQLKQKSLDAKNQLKEDLAQSGLSKEDVAKNAPDTVGASIAVPMMVD